MEPAITAFGLTASEQELNGSATGLHMRLRGSRSNSWTIALPQG